MQRYGHQVQLEHRDLPIPGLVPVFEAVTPLTKIQPP